MARRPRLPSDDAPEDPGKRVRRAALRMLERREFSAAELRRRLAAKGVEEAEAGAAIADLGARGLQSDARFAESMVRARVSRGYGPLRIAAELKARGVADAIGREALEAWTGEWAALAAQARRKRFGVLVPREWSERARQQRFLEYRGFEQDHIRSAMGEAEIDTSLDNDDQDV